MSRGNNYADFVPLFRETRWRLAPRFQGSSRTDCIAEQSRPEQSHVGEVVEEEAPELLDLIDSKSVGSRYERSVEGQMVGEAGM